MMLLRFAPHTHASPEQLPLSSRAQRGICFPLQNSRSLATLGMTSKLFKGPLQAGT